MRDRGRVRIDKSDKAVAAKRRDVKSLTGASVTTVNDAVAITVENREI